MRLPQHLPRPKDGAASSNSATVRRETWPYLETFTTGPFLGISLTTPVEQRIAWLREERPDYLMSFAESLEMLAMAATDEPVADSLKGLLAISEQTTPGMRQYIETRFRASVHQNYGLNEIGIVAARCDANRHHVHTEHCVAEIVDDEGQPCAAGATGRIVVTTLSNHAMPLIRYDTGDLAVVVEGPCPCGRTLPSFGEIIGRYSRVAFLPPGSTAQAIALREAVETVPLALARDLREFQVHQYRDLHVELRLVSRAPMPEAFHSRIRNAWMKTVGPNGPPLDIVQVDAIARTASGKAEVFTSDFMPARDAH